MEQDNTVNNTAIKVEDNERTYKPGFTYCAYCGQTFEVDAEGHPSKAVEPPDRMSVQAVSRHIMTCAAHPISHLKHDFIRALRYLEQSHIISAPEFIKMMKEKWGI